MPSTASRAHSIVVGVFDASTLGILVLYFGPLVIVRLLKTRYEFGWTMPVLVFLAAPLCALGTWTLAGIIATPAAASQPFGGHDVAGMGAWFMVVFAYELPFLGIAWAPLFAVLALIAMSQRRRRFASIALGTAFIGAAVGAVFVPLHYSIFNPAGISADSAALFAMWGAAAGAGTALIVAYFAAHRPIAPRSSASSPA
jgi:hypothetical protein